MLFGQSGRYGILKTRVQTADCLAEAHALHPAHSATTSGLDARLAKALDDGQPVELRQPPIQCNRVVAAGAGALETCKANCFVVESDNAEVYESPVKTVIKLQFKMPWSNSAMPVLMMNVRKMGMVVPNRLVPMLMQMRLGSIPLFAMLVLMVLIVLM